MLRNIFTAFFLANFIISTSLAQTKSTSEISISAHSEIYTPKSKLTAYFLLSDTNISAKKAFANISRLQTEFSEACKNLSFKIISEHSNFSSATSKNSFNKNSDIYATKNIEISSENPEHLAQIIDVAKSMNISLIGSTKSISIQGKQAKQKAINTALTEIKEKAQLISNELGVNLGKVISTSITEESQRAANFRGHKSGGAAASSNPPAARVLVQARFRIQ